MKPAQGARSYPVHTEGIPENAPMGYRNTASSRVEHFRSHVRGLFGGSLGNRLQRSRGQPIDRGVL